MDCSPPGSSVQGVIQARVLEWVAISFSIKYLAMSYSVYFCLSWYQESACNAGDPGLIPGSGRSPGEGIGYNSSILARRIPWSPWSRKESDMTFTFS